MSRLPLWIACLVGTLGAVSAQFEVAPVLTAPEILRPEILQGPHHLISDRVETAGFLNRYELRSDFGDMVALGNEQLAKRVHEYAAIAKLREYSQTAEFAKALENTASGTVDQVVNLVIHPGESLANIGSGAGKTVVRAREVLRRGLKKSGAEKEQASLLLGIDGVKRNLANQLQVDPYSTNPLLQEELTRVATPIVLADLSVTVGTFAIPGSTALTAYKGVKRTSDLSEKVAQLSPIDLRKLNRERLEAMDIRKKDAVRFLDEAWLPPIDQFALIELVDGFAGASLDGKRALIARASDAQNELDADFFARTFALLALYEEREAALLKQLLVVDGFPAGITSEGRLVIPLDIDFVAWTPQIAGLIGRFAPHHSNVGATIYLGGHATQNAEKALVALGFDLTQDLYEGIYRADWRP